MPETAAQRVISKIEELDIPKWRKLTEEENNAIDIMYNDVDTAEWKLKVKKFIEENFKEKWEARENLLRLTADLEQDNNTEIQNEALKQPLSMESLQENTSSNIMKKVLWISIVDKLWNSLTPKTKEVLKNTNNEWVFDLFIAQKSLKEGLNEFPALLIHQENIKLIMFKRVLEKIWTTSMFETIIEKWTSSFFWNKKEWENKQWDFDLINIKQVFDDLKTFNTWSIDPTKSEGFTIYNLDENEKIKEDIIQAPKSLKYLSDYIEKIVDTDFQNLKKLLNIAKERNLLEDKNFNALLDNTEVMDDLLKNGKTDPEKSMWYHINLEKWTLDLNIIDEIDINKVKNDFMSNITKLTDETWKPIDEITAWARNIANIIEKFTGYDIKELKVMLDKFAEEHPFIWWILKFIFWMVFNEGIMSNLDNLDSKIKKSVENLNKFKNEISDKSTLPFTIEKKLEDKNKQEKLKNIEKVLKNIQWWEDLKQIEWEKEKTSIIDSSTFWKDVLISKNSENHLIKQVQQAVGNIKKEKSIINESEFFKELAKITYKKEEKKDIKPKENTEETNVASVPIEQPTTPKEKPEPEEIPEPPKKPKPIVAVQAETEVIPSLDKDIAVFNQNTKKIDIAGNSYWIESINYLGASLWLELNNIQWNNIEFNVSDYKTRWLLMAKWKNINDSKVSFDIPEQDYNNIVLWLKENNSHTYTDNGLEIKFA